MKRSPLARRTPLQRQARLRPVNPERRARLHAEAFGEQAALCRRLQCCITGRFPAEPHHEPPRSRGGLDRDTVPLSRKAHDERHRVGRREFERRHGVDLREIAAGLARRIEEQSERYNRS